MRASTPNLAKRTIVRVAGYEDEVKGGFEQNSPIKMLERQGWAEVQFDHGTMNTVSNKIGLIGMSREIR